MLRDKAFLLSIGLFTLACGTDVSGLSSSGAGGNSGSGGNASTAGAGANDPTSPDPQFLPTASGSCPEFVNGKVDFNPAGIGTRSAHIWMGDNPQAQDGPLVFYWHGAGDTPLSAPYAVSNAAIDAVTSQGGVVVGAYADPAAGQFSWHLVSGQSENDLVFADEVLACAIEKVGIDVRRIHALGFSAGALNTAQMSYRRSGYLASVATYSGGISGPAPAFQEMENKFAAMIVHGGVNDTVIINFKTTSESYLYSLRENGHFAFICDHGNEHTVPSGAPSAAWQFFQDHPYGTAPSPYATELPASMPTYCTL